jgi:hypothetical protein
MIKIYQEALFHLRKFGVARYFQRTFRMGNIFPKLTWSNSTYNARTSNTLTDVFPRQETVIKLNWTF